MNLNANILLKNITIIENIIDEYLDKKICVMGKSLDFILLDKKECFNVSFHHGKLFSIYYQDEDKYSTIYTPFDNKKAKIIK